MLDDLLRREGTAAGIRRAVIDRGDDLRRAIVSRERYGWRRPTYPDGTRQRQACTARFERRTPGAGSDH